MPKRKLRSMINEVKTLIVKPKRTLLKITLAVLGILIIIAGIIFGLKYIRKPGIIQPKTIRPTPSPKTVISHELDTCAVTKEGNPLVESLSTQSNIIQGTYKGKITDLSRDPVIKSYIIKLSSLDEKQSFSFNIKDQKGLFFDSKGEIKGSALRTTQTLQISFTCNNNTNLLNFTKVLIL